MDDHSNTPPPLPLPAVTRVGYLRRHWRGQLPLAQSWWLNCVLLSLLFGAVNVLAQGGAAANTDVGLQMLALVAALVGLFGLMLRSWQLVGLWRSAGRHGGGWGTAARVLAALFGLSEMMVLWSIGLMVSQLSVAAKEQERWSHYTVSIAADGSSLDARGYIGVGFASAVIHALEAHPAIRRLHIDSLGGDIGNAERLAAYLQGRTQFEVLVDGECASACTRIFSAARTRLLGPDGRMDFHQGRALIANRFSAYLVEHYRQVFSGVLAANGASAEFIRKAFEKSGDQFYRPATAELFANGVVTGLLADGHVYTEAEWDREKYRYRASHDGCPAEYGAVIRVLPTAWPSVARSLHAQMASAELDEDVAHRLAQERLACGRAVGTVTFASYWRAGDDGLRGYAEDQRAIAMLLRDQVSPESCAHHARGESFVLGTAAEAYRLRIDHALHQLTDGVDARTARVPIGTAGVAELRRAQVAIEPPAAAGTARGSAAPAPVAACGRDIAMLDDLLKLPASPASAAALRGYLIERVGGSLSASLR